MSDGAISESDIYDENAIVDRLSENPAELESLLKTELNFFFLNLF